MSGSLDQAADIVSWLLFALPVTLLGCSVFTLFQPRGTADRLAKNVTRIAAIQAALALVALACFSTGALPLDGPNSHSAGLLGISILLDGVSLTMLALVSFVGWMICRYSIRYLDGDHDQASYYCWTAFTIGAVSLMVIAGNLLLLVACWMMTSAGLHHLLLHYNDRPAAHRAAWTKFAVSRIGDTALVIAAVLLYRSVGTLELSVIFESIRSMPTYSVEMQVAGVLLSVCAITKSAQFPFHTWLPLTMETPTPVSALMHAGIVNAGGYLIIRTSPIVSGSPVAMGLLTVFGLATVCYASIVMLTQTSIKKSLAYSTSAQMGFMILQVGLGAYSAAMLHLIAHSLYKAHAFLSSGSVLNEGAAMATSVSHKSKFSLATFATAIAALFAFIALSFAVTGINPQSKPGGVLLAAIMLGGLSSWLAGVIGQGNRVVITRAIFASAGLCLLYACSFKLVDLVIAGSLPNQPMAASSGVVWAIAVAGLGSMVLIQWLISQQASQPWMNRVRVHAANGFYAESAIRRVFGPLRSS